MTAPPKRRRPERPHPESAEAALLFRVLIQSEALLERGEWDAVKHVVNYLALHLELLGARPTIH